MNDNCKRPVLTALVLVLSIVITSMESIAQARETAVDLELVLAVDVSSSMNEEEQRVQRAGYVAALSDPTIIKAIRSGVLGRIAITYVEWASDSYQVVVVPWRLIESDASALSFAAELDGKPILRGTGTSISNGLLFASRLFANNGIEGSRQIIDISGDGPNSLGPPVSRVRDAVVGSGITINGLPLMLQPQPTGYAARPNLADYYQDCVIGGPGAFVESANSIDEIAATIRRKLALEISFILFPTTMTVQTVSVIKADCMIGQKQFYE